MSAAVPLIQAQLAAYSIGGKDVVNHTVVEGKQYKLDCKSTLSVPRPKYTWALAKEVTDAYPEKLNLSNQKRMMIDEEGKQRSFFILSRGGLY